MSVLKNLKRVLVRATLTRNLLSTSIADVSMDTAGEAFGAASAKGIESCNCPPGYTGRSCESCTPGFYQNRGRCQQCNCNGHNCHLTSYGDVVCDCRAHYSGVDCSIIDGEPQVVQTTTNRPPPPQSTVTVTISSPTIRIENVGGQVNFTCEARSRMIQGALPVNWTKVDGHLPQGRTYVDRNTGVLYISRVQVSDSGTYICQTSDGISTGQAIASLTVGSNPMTIPTVSIQPSVNEYYEGDRIELECVTTGNPIPKIVWQRASGQPLPLAVEYYRSYLVIPKAREEDSGEYRCIARNTAGSKDSIAAIFVRPRPLRPTRDRLTISPSTPNVVEGQSTNVICTGTASIPVGSIGWVRQDGSELAQNVRSENGVLYIDVARLENQGVYVCQTTSEQAASVPILVTVVPLSTPAPGEAPSISVSVDSLKIPTGGSGTIDCNPQGYPQPYIKWSKHNNNFGPGTSQRGNTLIISNAQDEDGGYYMCTGSVDGTVVANTYVMVEIETRIPPKVEIWPQGELAVTLGGQFEFHCRVLAGVPPPEILWSRSRERSLSRSTHLQPQAVLKFERIEVNDEGEYICTATNVAGQASANATLKVRSVPEITLTPGSFIEANPGEPVEVHCRANGYPEPMVSIKLRSDDRELVPPSPGSRHCVSARPTSGMMATTCAQLSRPPAPSRSSSPSALSVAISDSDPTEKAAEKLILILTVILTKIKILNKIQIIIQINKDLHLYSPSKVKTAHLDATALMAYTRCNGVE
ncbi:basement membrane-specific heparan sulfate proteoglycan core protein-like [Choristoneura fumiferana]|uniref:basement membrane-specific heparan sulfate proteoglycan core protein-like n=1 Tax=Choristoneura fumiferana TaxID=7141 RepID=UPI003D1589DA